METREIKTEVVRNGDQQGEAGRDQPGKRTVVAQVGNRSKVQGTVREGLRKDVRAYQQYQTKATKRGAQYGTTVTIDSSDTWTHKNLAYTDKSGGVHISNAISTDDFTEALEHEMNHVTFGIPSQQEVVYLPGTRLLILKRTTANDGKPLIFAQEVEGYGKDMERDSEN